MLSELRINGKYGYVSRVLPRIEFYYDFWHAVEQNVLENMLKILLHCNNDFKSKEIKIIGRHEENVYKMYYDHLKDIFDFFNEKNALNLLQKVTEISSLNLRENFIFNARFK